jgi:hypothetical protein
VSCEREENGRTGMPRGKERRKKIFWKRREEKIGTNGEERSLSNFLARTGLFQIFGEEPVNNCLLRLFFPTVLSD